MEPKSKEHDRDGTIEKSVVQSLCEERWCITYGTNKLAAHRNILQD